MINIRFTPVNFLFPKIPLPANFKRDAAQRKMASIYRDIINERRAMKEEDHPPDMIWNLMNQQYKDGRPTTDTEVAHMMIALLMAGQHTSMATSAWTVLHLGAKPEYMYADPHSNLIVARYCMKSRNASSGTDPWSTTT